MLKKRDVFVFTILLTHKYQMAFQMMISSCFDFKRFSMQYALWPIFLERISMIFYDVDDRERKKFKKSASQVCQHNGFFQFYSNVHWVNSLCLEMFNLPCVKLFKYEKSNLLIFNIFDKYYLSPNIHSFILAISKLRLLQSSY